VIVQNASDFHGAGGTRLFRRSWLPDAAPRGVIVLVHGFGEHSERYAWVGEQLAGSGYAVHTYDLRGHGRSEGPRARVRSFREHLDDLDAFFVVVRGESGGEPPFLFGHSMGGLIAALYAAVRRPALRGLILSGPAVAEPGRGAKLAARAVGVVAKAAPGLPAIKLRASSVSRDPAVVKAYEDDPLVHHGGIPAATLAAFPRAISRLHTDAANITMPLLIVHGTADELAPAAGAQALFDHVASHDRVLKLYDGLAHEVLNEPEKAMVMADIKGWLDAH
jgi:acylglycerol lipase